MHIGKERGSDARSRIQKPMLQVPHYSSMIVLHPVAEKLSTDSDEVGLERPNDINAITREGSSERVQTRFEKSRFVADDPRTADRLIDIEAAKVSKSILGIDIPCSISFSSIL